MQKKTPKDIFEVIKSEILDLKLLLIFRVSKKDFTRVRKQTKAKKNKNSSNKTSKKQKSSAGKASIGTPTTIKAVNSIKDLISQKNSAYVNANGSVKLDVVQSKLDTLGVTTSPASLGINKYGATSKRY